MEDQVAAFREFNRFHTRFVGALNEHLLASDYSLPQVRVLYEVANAPDDIPPSARDLGDTLKMDKGYLSRIVSTLVDDGLIDRVPSKWNAKRLALSLTAKGKAVFDQLTAASAREAAAVLEKLSNSERHDLVVAMSRVQRLLCDDPQDAVVVLRDPEPGDLGLIISQHGRLYAEEYRWDWTFEARVAEIIGQFARTFDPGRERCWIAEREGEIIGSVLVVRQDEDTAKLRLLYVDARARGLGLGRLLVDQCLNFARRKGYKRMVLWTNDVLVSARRIYEAAGFELLQEESHRSFGQDLIGQMWGRDL